jgi:DNA replication and repair protein RecF
MHVTHLALADFRSYRTADLPLERGVTALIGPNGQGKTNLVEAIGYVASHSSHRVSTDAPLIRSGASRAIVRCAIARDDRSALIELEIVPSGSNRARINRSAATRPRDALGILRTVLFAPEDLAIVKGDPDGRRRFLDDLLVTRRPRFAGVRSDYDRVLRQRNALLKSARSIGRSGRGGRDEIRTLDVWDSHLVTAGSALLAARIELVRELSPLVATAYAAVAGTGGTAGQGDAGVSYRSSVDDDASTADLELLQGRMVEALARVRANELERGVSLVGPHRDDLVLTLGGLPARGYASHGESWSFALALRLASYDLLCSDGGAEAEPVLILDDVFAELDGGRRERLAGLVAGAEQVLVTAAVADDVPTALDGARVDVLAGEVTRVR